MRLKDYQVEGVRNVIGILNKYSCALLADDMGLGKTAQAISILKELQPKKVLIVAPASLIYNWEKEFKLWCNPELIERGQVQVVKTPTTAKVNIVSYNLFQKSDMLFCKAGYDFIVYDEAHYLKSPDSKRTKTALRLHRLGRKILMLTGTPVTSYTRDLFVPCHMALGPTAEIFRSKWKFFQHYCGMKRTPFGWDTTGTSNAGELSLMLKRFMVRRTKASVLKELPNKIKSHVPMALDSIKATDYARETLRSIEGLDLNDPAILEKLKFADHIATARRRLGVLKVPAALEFINGILEQKRPVVVFAAHKEVMDLLETGLKEGSYNVARVDGSVSNIERQRLVEEFQAGKYNVFLGQVIAAGTGITLTASQTAIFVELDWNPGTNVQAEDRIHRIGQTEPVDIYCLSARNSLDYALNELLINKSQNIETLIKETTNG